MWAGIWNFQLRKWNFSAAKANNFRFFRLSGHVRSHSTGRQTIDCETSLSEHIWMKAKHLVEASSWCSVAKALRAMIIRGVVSFVLFHLSSALFENCDDTFNLDTDASLTIGSVDSLNARNASSCRYTLIAPASSIVEINCLLDIRQPGSETCPIKRLFVSVDGMRDLRGAEYFCSRNGSKRTVRRRSVMNRLVMAFATKAAVGDESFACVARRISSRCDCGWSRRVGTQHPEFRKVFN